MITSESVAGGALAVTRFGLGARPGEIASAASDPRGWLIYQITPAGADLFDAQTSQEQEVDMREAHRRFRELKASFGKTRRQEANVSATAGKTVSEGASMTAGQIQGDQGGRDFKTEKREIVQPGVTRAQNAILARVQLATMTDAPFRERWALFWANHFTVAAKNPKTRALAPSFEREAVRPHVFGRFESLLLASSTHPGMIAYLDQQRSVGSESVLAKREAGASDRRALGLNENLAREILELHTVGAEGGFGQADVTEFARALTGLGIGGARDEAAGLAVFRDERHEPGSRLVMGKRFDQAGQDQAKAILADLARRPQTARLLCTKIAAHFVADAPDPRLVARLEAAWTESQGELAHVARVLIAAPEAWAPPAEKLKAPYEFVVSSYRAIGARPIDARRDVITPLQSLGQRPFGAPQPNGWPDRAAAWAAPDAVVKRLAWAEGFAAANLSAGDPRDVALSSLGSRLRPATTESIARAESPAEGLAILLMSPEFQRR